MYFFPFNGSDVRVWRKIFINWQYRQYPIQFELATSGFSLCVARSLYEFLSQSLCNVVITSFNYFIHCILFVPSPRLEYFSVQFFGECWSGPNAGKTFARDGESKKCYKGVGDKNANYVYRLEDLPRELHEL